MNYETSKRIYDTAVSLIRKQLTAGKKPRLHVTEQNIKSLAHYQWSNAKQYPHRSVYGQKFRDFYESYQDNILQHSGALFTVRPSVGPRWVELIVVDEE
jgi:hypothetical protein